MTWSAVKTWAFGDPWTVGDANKYFRDDPQYLRDSIRYVGWVSIIMGVWNNGGSGVFADFGGANKVQATGLVKRQASSTLQFIYECSCWLTVVGEMQFGIKIGATTYNGRMANFSIANNHDVFVGAVDVSGLAAGTYTATLEARTVTGGGLISTDGGDVGGFDILEVSTA